MNEVKFKANIKDLNAVQTAVEAIPAIPAPTVANAGKVLTVTVDSSGETPVAEYGLAEGGGGGLPAIESGDAGKVLTVNAGETAAEWAAPRGGADIFRVVKTVQGSTKQLDWQYDDVDNAYTAYTPWLQLGQDDLNSGNVTLQDDVTITIGNEETDIDGKKTISGFEVYLSNLDIDIYITQAGDLSLSSQTQQSIQSLAITNATVLAVTDDLALAISLVSGDGR